ncbi:ribonuclease VapC [Spirochaetia bacterium]|nr:ribonuclease VapC [Spirochaetia bacterium]
MNFLIDTNVLSELGKKNPSPKVRAFMSALPSTVLFISVVSLGEIVKGIEKTSEMNRKNQLLVWYEKICRWFDGQIIDIDHAIMTDWGHLAALHKRTLPVLDSLLAATCLRHSLTLVTRNTKDFSGISGLNCQNPWNQI